MTKLTAAEAKPRFRPQSLVGRASQPGKQQLNEALAAALPKAVFFTGKPLPQKDLPICHDGVKTASDWGSVATAQDELD